MLIDDGGGLDEPLNRDAIKGIDGMRVYERAIVQPDWTAAIYGLPQYYNVSSMSGYFTVHASRCLVFKNGILPEHTVNAQYRFWGLPEYLRIRNEFDIEKLLDDLPEEDLMAGWEDRLLPTQGEEQPPTLTADGEDTSAGVGVLILNDTGEKVLCGKRDIVSALCRKSETT